MACVTSGVTAPGYSAYEAVSTGEWRRWASESHSVSSCAASSGVGP